MIASIIFDAVNYKRDFHEPVKLTALTEMCAAFHMIYKESKILPPEKFKTIDAYIEDIRNRIMPATLEPRTRILYELILSYTRGGELTEELYRLLYDGTAEMDE